MASDISPVIRKMFIKSHGEEVTHLVIRKILKGIGETYNLNNVTDLGTVAALVDAVLQINPTIIVTDIPYRLSPTRATKFLRKMGEFKVGKLLGEIGDNTIQYFDITIVNKTTLGGSN